MKSDDREALLRFLAGKQLLLPELWDDDTPLIQSGILDSMALLELIVWLEDRLGQGVDPTGFELAEELGSVRDILRFLERRRSNVGRPAP